MYNISYFINSLKKVLSYKHLFYLLLLIRDKKKNFKRYKRTFNVNKVKYVINRL